MAVPSARTAVLEWLGIKGVKVTRVDKLPKVSLLSDMGLGEPVTLAEARRRAPGLVEPHLKNLGAPDEVYFSSGVPGGQVTFLWGTKDEARLLMIQSPGEVVCREDARPAHRGRGRRRRRAARSLVLGRRALLRLSRPQRQIREETSRLARNTLLWQYGDLTVRLEGELSKRRRSRSRARFGRRQLGSSAVRLPVLIVAALLLAGCSGDDGGGGPKVSASKGEDLVLTDATSASRSRSSTRESSGAPIWRRRETTRVASTAREAGRRGSSAGAP